MALYKHANILVQSGDQAFDFVYAPGSLAPHTGLYRCITCGYEIVMSNLQTFPDVGCHTKTESMPMGWRLGVYAQISAFSPAGTLNKAD
ncbi:hypothetical protein ACO0K2_01355 [Undibacterium sp. MH2W]|uniref:hypothetical protein n=1 Tax=Undibacterium sp. MH2W TaxID=3413044 RepID=UPI003BF45D0A